MGCFISTQCVVSHIHVAATKTMKFKNAGIFLPFQNRDLGPMILGKIICISVKLGKWIQNRTGDNMHILC